MNTFSLSANTLKHHRNFQHWYQLTLRLVGYHKGTKRQQDRAPHTYFYFIKKFWLHNVCTTFISTCCKFWWNVFKPRHEKTGFLPICENKGAAQLYSIAKLISAFVFATPIVQLLFFLHVNPKFRASSHLL